MRVLHVVPGLAARGGGVSSTVVELALGLQERGVETSVFATDLAGPAHASPRRSVRADELPPGADALDVRCFRSAPPRRLAYSPALARALRREAGRFDVVHVHSLWLHPQLAAARAARQHGVPYVVSPHGMLDPYLRPQGRMRKALAQTLWQRSMLRHASFLHFTADDEARLAADVAPRTPRRVIGNPVPVDLFEEPAGGEAFRRGRLGGHDGPVVLSLGRISRKKGLDVLVRAFARVTREHPNALLAIVGPDDDGLQAELAQLAQACGVGERVAFPGVVTGAERLAAFAAADVFALASHSENFAVAVVEALAAGLPAVISSAVNIGAEVARAGAGVVTDGSVESVAGAVGTLLADADARRDLGERGRAFARRFDRATIADEFAAAYAACIGTGARAFSLEAARA